MVFVKVRPFGQEINVHIAQNGTEAVGVFRIVRTAVPQIYAQTVFKKVFDVFAELILKQTGAVDFFHLSDDFARIVFQYVDVLSLRLKRSD